MKVHHIGIAVKSITKAVKKYELLGYKVEKEIIWDKQRNINILFMTNGTERIELIETVDISMESPVKNLLYLKTNMMYHICFETNDIIKQITQLQSQGFVIINKPDKAPACEEKTVAFLFSRETGVIELIEVRGN